MKYDLKEVKSMLQARAYLEKLIESASKIELKKIPKKRSLDQNRYYHVITKIWADEYGYFMEEAKTEIKHELGYYEVKESGAVYYDETSKMSSAELSRLISKFRDWSSINGLYLMSSEEYIENQFHIDNELENQ